LTLFSVQQNGTSVKLLFYKYFSCLLPREEEFNLQIVHLSCLQFQNCQPTCL